MFTTKRIVFTCAFLLAVITASWMLNRPGSVAPPAEEQEVVVAIAVDGDVDTESTERTYDAGLPTSQDNCLAPWQIESHPLIIAETNAMESLNATGPTMSAYRDLSRADVQALAAQNDTAAMAVLGAMAMLRAKDIDESRAVDLLQFSDISLRQELSRAKQHENSAEEYELAGEWFYKSAMHGRLFALTSAGEVLYMQNADPVFHGLVTQSYYDALSNVEKAYLNPMNIYAAAALDIAGNPQDGMFGMISTALVRSKPMDEMAAKIAHQFAEDQTAAGLPPINIPSSTMPPIEELAAMLCEEYRPD